MARRCWTGQTANIKLIVYRFPPSFFHWELQMNWGCWSDQTCPIISNVTFPKAGTSAWPEGGVQINTLKTHPILQPILEFVCQPLADERSGVEAYDPACRQEPNTTSCRSFPTAADEVRILGDVYDTLQLGDLLGGWVGSLDVRGCTSYRAAGCHVRHRYSYYYYRDKPAALNISFQLTAKILYIFTVYLLLKVWIVWWVYAFTQPTEICWRCETFAAGQTKAWLRKYGALKELNDFTELIGKDVNSPQSWSQNI